MIRAMVPLREMIGYATILRSKTAGEATFSMELGGFEPVGDIEQKKIILAGGV
jgi:elongation factor G